MKKMFLVNLLTAVPFLGTVLTVIWLSASTTAPSPGYILIFAAPLWIVASIIASIIFRLLSWQLNLSLPKAKRPDKLSLVTLALCLATIASVAVTSWPLRLAHIYSQGAFDGLAAAIKSGHEAATPRPVGLFTIDEVELDNGLICLWLPTDDYLDQKGFVQGSSKRVLWQYQSYQDIVKLNGNWWFVSCDG